MRFFVFRGHLFRFLAVFVVAMVLFEFYVFLRVSRDRRMAQENKYVQDYEMALCSFSLPWRKVEKSERKCPGRGIVTSFKQGGLSSNMWQYANVIAASIVTGLDAYLPSCLRDVLVQVFDNVSLPLLAEIGHCRLPLPESASSVAEWTGPGQSIVIAGSDLVNDAVVKFVDVIADGFVFTESLANVALVHLHRAKGNRTEAVFVGVYITRTSVVVNQEYDDVYPSVDFFVEAVKLFRKDCPNAVFVVIADREAFWRSIFKEPDVHVTDENSFGVYGAVLSVLSHCNHTILASNGVAVWAAIFSGGRTVMSLSLSDDFISLTRRYPEWKFLVNATDSEKMNLEKIF